MTAPSQDPTPWELLRALQQMRDDLRGDFAQFTARLAEMVTRIQYEADRRADDLRVSALEADLQEVREDRDRERQQAAANRRLAVTALVAPLLVTIVGALLLAMIGL
ncbi:hypothetical protein ABZ649_04695 [Streptomyces albidoflavus]|uniref:hypothetical protein n=1 Tax=Streptomyces albidoflavus TaxID=1886 RepID=UPI0033D4B6BB